MKICCSSENAATHVIYEVYFSLFDERPGELYSYLDPVSLPAIIL